MTLNTTLHDPLNRPFARKCDCAVLHVVISLDVGGLERVVLDLLASAPRLHQRVSVLCLERPGKLAVRAEQLGAQVLCAEKPPGFRPGIVRGIAEQIRKLQPDVVHSHQIGALFYAAPAARRAGVPVVVHTEHGKHYASRLRTRILGRWATRSADRVFCVCEDIAVEMRNCRIVDPDRISVLPNGIDVHKFESYSDPALREKLAFAKNAKVIGTVGRLTEIKRQDVLLEGFARAAKTIPDARLMIVGDGPLRNDLQQTAARLGIESLVHFAGYQSEPQKYLAEMNVFALTSRSEGMPLCILEAWAAGLPVVASNVGGLPGLIDGTQAGVLFPSGDADALAAQLIDLLGNETKRTAMGHRGREIAVQSYSLERMADDYHRHYQELLEANRRTGATRARHE